MWVYSTQFPVFQLFANEWLSFAVFLAGILGIVGLAEFLRSRLRWSAEASRKIVHVTVGVLIFWARFLFVSPLPALVLATIFIGLNLLALVRGGFQGMHATQRFSLGTAFYPLSFLILVLLYWYRDPAILLISFLILALGDPLAAQVGEIVRNPLKFTLWKDHKSVQGSAALGILAALLTGFGLYILRTVDSLPMPSIQILVLTSLAVGIISALAEGISWAGSDNLTLPLCSALTMEIILHNPILSQGWFFLWMLLAFVFAYGAYRLEVLTPDGAAAAFLLGTFVFGIGGLRFMLPMGAFFVLSSILSKLGNQKKHLLETVYEKTSNRDMMQVLANGGVAGLMAILWHFTRSNLFYYGFLGSLAAATADTWGTEIGVFARQQPRSILTFRPVEAGTSGGITPIGTTGALLGSGVLALTGWVIPAGTLAPFFKSTILITIITAGLLGAIADSILGATIQAQYFCDSCQKITEKRTHCPDGDTKLSRGFSWINNDVVNTACTAIGGILTLLLLA